jgi:hypothetical protein
MKDNIKQYAISTAITFFTGFIVELAISLENATSFADMSLKAVMLGCIFAGFRLTVKFLVQITPMLSEKVIGLIKK